MQPCRQHRLPPALLVAVAVLAVASCALTEPAPQLSRLWPDAAPQDHHVALYGASLGDRPGEVYVGGTCAAILGWTPHVVDILVPTGIGTGERLVVVVTPDGERATGSLRVLGDNLPPRPAGNCPRPPETQRDGDASPPDGQDTRTFVDLGSAP